MTRSRDFAKGATRTEFDYTATAGQTTFTGNDNDSESLSYTAGQIDVYLNGSHLNVTDDYVATNGTSVVLESGAQAGDSLVIVAYGSFNVANVVATRDLEGNEFILDDDGDTTITADTDDQIDIKIAGADDFKFTANTFSALDGSSVIIGGGSSRTVGGVTGALQVEGTAINDSSMTLMSNGASGTDGLPAKLVFGRSGAASLGSNTVVADGNEIGVISFQGADGTDVESQAASIFVTVAGTPGGNDMPGRMHFHTTADGSSGATLKLQINHNGQMLFGKNTNNFGTAGGCFNDGGSKNGALELICDGEPSLALNRLSSDGSIIVFHKDSSSGGSITTTASTTAYNTTSDYRLKENVDYSWTATTRLKTLKPCRFNFTADSDNTIVDGFLAHEVSNVVPEAVHGDKDATRTARNVVTDSSDNYIGEDVLEEDWTEGKTLGVYANDTKWVATKTMPKYQQLDQAKLVPLLVKTIQELEARITALES